VEITFAWDDDFVCAYEIRENQICKWDGCSPLMRRKLKTHADLCFYSS
jgi:hypothetical protein